MTFSDGGSMTILVTQYKCHYYAFVMKTHIFSDDNGSSRIVKSLVVYSSSNYQLDADLQKGKIKRRKIFTDSP